MSDDKNKDFEKNHTQNLNKLDKELTKKQVILYTILLIIAIVICVLAMIGVNIFVLIIIIGIVFLYVYLDEDIGKDDNINSLSNNSENPRN